MERERETRDRTETGRGGNSERKIRREKGLEIGRKTEGGKERSRRGEREEEEMGREAGREGEMR